MTTSQSSELAILQALEPTIRTACRRRMRFPLPSHLTLDDVLQEVRIAIVKALPAYREEGKLHGWAATIAKYKMIDMYRAAGRDHSRLVDEMRDNPDPSALTAESAIAAVRFDDLAPLLRTLSKRDRMIVFLVKAQGRRPTDIAPRMGMTPNHVRVTLHRALKRLRSNLMDVEGTD